MLCSIAITKEYLLGHLISSGALLSIKRSYNCYTDHVRQQMCVYNMLANFGKQTGSMRRMLAEQLHCLMVDRDCFQTQGLRASIAFLRGSSRKAHCVI